MNWVRDILASLGLLSLLLAGVERSWRALIFACLFMAAAYAIHRRVIAAWWLGCGLFVCAFVDSLISAYRGPRTDLALMSSLLGMLMAVLALSLWSRQRRHFLKTNLPEAPKH